MTSIFSRFVLFFLFKAGLATLAFPRYSKFGPFSLCKIYIQHTANISSLLSTFLGTSNVRVAGILCCRCLFKFNCVFRFWWTLSRSLYFTMLLTNFIFQAVKSISKGEALTVRYTPFLQVDKNYLCFVISFFLNGNKISQLKTIEGCHLRAGLVWLAGWGRSASPRALAPGWWIGLWIEGTFREIERYFEPLMEYLRAWDAWGIFVSKRM